VPAKVIFLLASLPWFAFAGLENNGRGARPVALANAFVAIGKSPWSTFYNPAGLASARTVEGSVFLVPEQFGLKELRSVSAAAIVPLGVATAGFAVGRFGFELFQETTVAIGAGTYIDEGIAVGGTFNLVRISFERYGSTTTPAFDVGALVDVADGLHLGFQWKNVTAATVGGAGETLAQSQDVGMCYEFSEASRIAIELEKDIRFPFSIKAGYEQWFLQMLSLRFGVASNPDKFSLGLGVSFAGLEFSYAGYSHAQLGWTHQIELSFKLDR
jgi:hypothetical protein